MQAAIGDKRVMESLTMEDIKINTSTLQRIKSLDVFSEMDVYPMVFSQLLHYVLLRDFRIVRQTITHKSITK